MSLVDIVTMYDSTTVADIPADAQAVAGYVDGAYRNLAELTARFPDVPVISITVTGIGGVRVADIENGAMTAMQGAEWAKAEIAAGRRPTLYYARSSRQVIAACLNGALVDPLAVDYWVADWTGTPHLITGSVATQYANPDTSGGHYDLSEALEIWLRPAVVPPDDPTTGGVDDMTVIDSVEQNQRHVFGVVNGVPFHWWQTLKPGQGQNFDWSHEQLPTA